MGTPFWRKARIQRKRIFDDSAVKDAWILVDRTKMGGHSQVIPLRCLVRRAKSNSGSLNMSVSAVATADLSCR
jgi:hypothetical protein